MGALIPSSAVHNVLQILDDVLAGNNDTLTKDTTHTEHPEHMAYFSRVLKSFLPTVVKRARDEADRYFNNNFFTREHII